MNERLSCAMHGNFKDSLIKMSEQLSGGGVTSFEVTSPAQTSNQRVYAPHHCHERYERGLRNKRRSLRYKMGERSTLFDKLIGYLI